ncbi:von Willebrand factor type A domain-containing protein [Cytobacillus oceanisediminis]|uniref:von Willebrand factor type A domain-containing protein n=1 Tax=Cytobacillus oceanisediminis TaxID=665099 RepID=A0A2V2ZSQ2_9BACI|nr:VWA domain-containing protein [Cytobacillus oceanisediminis]PWW27398.1 von Willebrand factor type A domain-containing protein [Cytobacillus oceanisediminis]
MGIEVKYPFLFLLFIPAVLLIFLYLWKHRTKGNENYWIAGLRMVVFSLLIFALTVPQILLPVNGETVIFLADRSASIGETEEALAWIENSVSHKKSEDQYAVAAFGEHVALEQNLGRNREAVAQFNGKVDDSQTNLEAGLQFAASLMPRDSAGRIVLLSDGNETSGNSLEAASILKNRQIEIDHVLLKTTSGEDVSISELSVPPSLYLGEEAPITIEVTSNTSKKADIRLSVNHKEVFKQTVQVNEGKNVYTFTHKADKAGLTVYKAEIAAEQDTFTENNTLHSVVNVKGTPKVLIVQGTESGNIEELLEGSGLMADTVQPEKLPTVMSGYLQYQSIIFNNVPATVISENQMNLMEKAVKEFGTGFIMMGGDESFGLGGYFKTPIERLLPVEMDIKGKKEMPSLGLVLVMDRSGSMAGSKIELAKEAAARSVELLREEDTLGVIAFDDRPWEILETEPLKDKKKAIDKIRSITPGGGTEIFASLEQAFSELEDLKLQRKHIILLTDGQSSTNNDYDLLIESGKEKNITLSTVALGQDADRSLLEDLAAMGSGRFYDVTDSSVIPSILSRETVMATRTYIEDNPFYPSVQPYPEWSALFEKGVPKMNAYIASTAKPRSEVPVLSEKEDPVLAEWQYGMGRTIAFTSDFSGKWSGDWARWEKWPLFINQLVTKTLPQYESEPYRISVEKRDGSTVLNLESANSQSLPIETSIVSETGEQIEANTRLTAPAKYEATLPESSGMYFLNIKQADQNGNVQIHQTGFTIPYSVEYLQKGANKEHLEELSKLTGGKGLEAEIDSFRPLKNPASTKQPISEWLILAAFLIFFTEIALRRFGLIGLVGGILKKNRKKAVKEKREKTEKFAKLQPAREKIAKADEAPVLKEHLSNEKPIVKAERKKQKPSRQPEMLTPKEREERMKRLLDAKNRKNK